MCRSFAAPPNLIICACMEGGTPPAERSLICMLNHSGVCSVEQKTHVTYLQVAPVEGTIPR